MSASQYLSSSALLSDSVGSIIKHPVTGKDMVGAWNPGNKGVLFDWLSWSESRVSVHGGLRPNKSTDLSPIQA